MGLAFVGLAVMAGNLFYCIWKYRKKIGSLLTRAAASKADAAAASSGGDGENGDEDEDDVRTSRVGSKTVSLFCF